MSERKAGMMDQEMHEELCSYGASCTKCFDRDSYQEERARDEARGGPLGESERLELWRDFRSRLRGISPSTERVLRYEKDGAGLTGYFRDQARQEATDEGWAGFEGPVRCDCGSDRVGVPEAYLLACRDCGLILQDWR